MIFKRGDLVRFKPNLPTGYYNSNGLADTSKNHFNFDPGFKSAVAGITFVVLGVHPNSDHGYSIVPRSKPEAPFARYHIRGCMLDLVIQKQVKVEVE